VLGDLFEHDVVCLGVAGAASSTGRVCWKVHNELALMWMISWLGESLHIRWRLWRRLIESLAFASKGECGKTVNAIATVVSAIVTVIGQSSN
jgi:hypothetical protein